MSFTQRQISVDFSLAAGNFEGGGNSVSITALGNPDPNAPRISARIEGPGGEFGIVCTVAIWGMPLSTMNQLSVIGRRFATANAGNTMTIKAGDGETGMQKAFSGTISQAYVDAQSQPHIAFRVEGRPGAALAAKNSAATSVKGEADVAQLMQRLASQAGLQFRNQGNVSIKLRNPYLWGSIGNQIKSLARAAGLEHIIDRGELSIWKPGSGDGSGLIISPSTGMVGYPTFNQAAVIVRTIFNPQIKHNQKITIQSDLTPACGDWSVSSVTHEIESNIPKGKWFTIIKATSIGAETASN